MTTPILVTGGTGTLGRLVVERLRHGGTAVRVLARSAGEPLEGVEYVTGDLQTGVGVSAAVEGVRTIIHCAGSGKGDGIKADSVVRAAQAAGVTHLVYISVVGADRVPVVSGMDRMAFGYYEQKRLGELAIEQSGIPFTILRATQFHDLTLLAARGLAKLPIVPIPKGVSIQPIAANEVADRLVELALGAPQRLVPDLAGPRVYLMADLVRGYLGAIGKRRPMVMIGMGGGAAAAMRAGANLSPERAVGTTTWEQFLAERVSA